MTKRKLSLLYIFFYLLFSVDTWRVIIGIGLAVFLAPQIVPDDLSLSGEIVVWLMITAIGWWVSYYPARMIAGFLKQIVIKK